ncbi:hypothetical protein N657DRAFT_650569 [Parathielavia appendiculata]|uniref:Uncharacterized protein n=1 Tax=Parathielavia appendiculata TaxID=2587402 RepID=A0AAN6TSA8_9PEZI|nr:hypothetical protein N657DRAFT_650569 [Parathielavia appendiculata]
MPGGPLLAVMTCQHFAWIEVQCSDATGYWRTRARSILRDHNPDVAYASEGCEEDVGILPNLYFVQNTTIPW